MATPNRITSSRPSDQIKTSLADLIAVNNAIGQNRMFYYGQVIDSNDPKNANRIKVRIPLLDDVFYLNDKNELEDSIGDDKLPYCLPANSHFIDTPENGSVVLVGLFDLDNPYAGRVYFNVLSELNNKNIFDKSKLTEEQTGDNAWETAEKSIEYSYNSTPGLRGNKKIKSKQKTKNDKIGIKGKDKNKLIFEDGKTYLIQNEGDINESKIEITGDIDIRASDMINILSKQGTITHSPVFADPLFVYLELVNVLLAQLVLVHTTVPSLWLGAIPNGPSPASSGLPGTLSTLQQQLQQLKQIGKSKKIKIN
jgi:hypothetical protein